MTDLTQSPDNTEATGSKGMPIQPVQADFIFAVDGCGLSREWFTVDFDKPKWRNTVKAFGLKDETPLAFYLIRHFASAETVLFTNKGCHIAQKKEGTSFQYEDIETVDDSLLAHLTDGRTIQIPKLPHSNQKLASLLRSIKNPEAYAALRADVQSATKKYTPFSGTSVVIGIISAVILWNVIGGFHGFIIGYIVGHIIGAVISKAVAPDRNTESTAADTEQQNTPDQG